MVNVRPAADLDVASLSATVADDVSWSAIAAASSALKALLATPPTLRVFAP
jgi:hypothetical protein